MTTDIKERLQAWLQVRKDLDAAMEEAPHKNTILVEETIAHIEQLEGQLSAAMSGWKQNVEELKTQLSAQTAVQTEQPSLSDAQLKYVQECIERAKLLPVWDGLPSSLHAELDNIFRGVALLAQSQDSDKPNFGAIVDAWSHVPNDIKPELEHLGKLIMQFSAAIANGSVMAKDR